MGNKICKQCDEVAVPYSTPQLCQTHYISTSADTCRGYYKADRNNKWIFCKNNPQQGTNFCKKCTCSLTKCQNNVNHIGRKKVQTLATTCDQHACIKCGIRPGDGYKHCNYCRCVVDGCDKIKHVHYSYFGPNTCYQCEKHTCKMCAKRVVGDGYEGCGVHICTTTGCKHMRLQGRTQCINCINASVLARDGEQKKVQQNVQPDVPPMYGQ